MPRQLDPFTSLTSTTHLSLTEIFWLQGKATWQFWSLSTTPDARWRKIDACGSSRALSRIRVRAQSHLTTTTTIIIPTTNRILLYLYWQETSSYLKIWIDIINFKKNPTNEQMNKVYVEISTQKEPLVRVNKYNCPLYFCAYILNMTLSSPCKHFCTKTHDLKLN